MTSLPLRGHRILILGAGGWFGSTLLHELAGVADSPDTRVMALASQSRDHLVAGRHWSLGTWDTDAIAKFAPTVVANFAYLTRERFDAENPDEYIAANTALQAQFLLAAQLPEVRIALTVSSGAAVALRDEANPYGRMKAEEEEQALALATSQRSIVVARAWSVSGPFVRRPHAYAFSDLILQARSGQIRIAADRPVYRRYVDVGDYLNVCLTRGLQAWSGVIDSGGPMVEMLELAEQTRNVVNPAATIDRPPMRTAEPAIYASDDRSWQLACEATSSTPKGLPEQIAYTEINMTEGPI